MHQHLRGVLTPATSTYFQYAFGDLRSAPPRICWHLPALRSEAPGLAVMA
jgi:hypothetical protein